MGRRLRAVPSPGLPCRTCTLTRLSEKGGFPGYCCSSRPFMGRNAAPVKLLCMIARFFPSVKGNTREMQDCPGSLHPGVKARRITSSLATERQAVNRQPWRQLPALVDRRESSLVQQALQTDLQRLNAGNRATRPTATQSIESGTRPRAAMAGDPASRSIDRRKSIAPMACKREAGGAKSKQRSRGNPLTGRGKPAERQRQ